MDLMTESVEEGDHPFREPGARFSTIFSFLKAQLRRLA
jgi:hypothetical protein